jgi:hypothetical protein
MIGLALISEGPDKTRKWILDLLCEIKGLKRHQKEMDPHGEKVDVQWR